MERDIRVLYVGSDGSVRSRLATALEAELPTITIDATGCAEEAGTLAETESFDCAVATDTRTDAAAAAAVRSVSDADGSLPVVCLAESFSTELARRVYDAGATACLPLASSRDYEQAADRIAATATRRRADAGDVGKEGAGGGDGCPTERARRFRQAVEQAADAVFITDADGTIEYVNPSFEALTGYERSEAVGRTPRILRSGEQDDAYYARMWQTILAGDVWQEEIVNERQSGEYYHAEQTVAPIVDDTGEADGFVAIQRDITERKEREHQRALNERRLRVLFEQAPDGIVVHDIDGEVLDVNCMLVEMLGYDRETLLSMSVPDFEIGIDPEKLRERWRSMDTGSTHKIEVQGTHQRKDGTTYPVEVWVSKIESAKDDGARFIAFVRDVSNRRHREIHLEEAQQVGNIGWWRKEIPSDEIYWSEQVYEMWGVDGDRGTIDHETFMSYIHPEDRDHVGQAWQEAKEGAPYDIEHRVVTGDGDVRWVREKAELTFDDNGNPTSAVGIVQDITEQKTREQELERTKHRLSLAIDTADAGVWELDADSGRMQLTDSMQDLVGLDTEVDGDTHGWFLDRIHPDDRETVRAAVENALSQEDGFEREFRFRHTSGEYIWLLARSRVLTDGAGDPERLVGVAIDISERIDRARQLRVLDRVLRHNLRNDMTAILGYAETIRDEVPEAAPAARTIIEEGKSLLRTADKEREIVEVISDPPQRTRLEVGELCRRAVEAARKSHADAAIEFEADAEAAAVGTENIRRAVSELLENAIRHYDGRTPEVMVRVDADDDVVRISVADRGPGIPDREVNVLTRERDIEPLYHGSGLGLWLVNWIVRRSNGRLSFEANEPRGSVVTIELRRAA
ncbi:receiver/sensor box histidine kinase [Natronomonas pharaonis DSM 2160]|uniref:histidine kinase n=1 Tax=Natronomonas pharaonis (strain ATCC 35678 / DSM 2160 / CIP 103997 / JCM 8858 / NBRC 14720 / NCIMB 2260 / Gabara) TaxID=348780 RepID=A0A1U7EWK6_NATPD|nr:PAS domain S-box protein [Natronomonas pharaonis]CAI49462.1 receiver/sensor box histidine kinase [Natronomonas pharaonis DSM 2160]